MQTGLLNYIYTITASDGIVTPKSKIITWILFILIILDIFCLFMVINSLILLFKEK